MTNVVAEISNGVEQISGLSGQEGAEKIAKKLDGGYIPLKLRYVDDK